MRKTEIKAIVTIAAVDRIAYGLLDHCKALQSRNPAMDVQAVSRAAGTLPRLRGSTSLAGPCCLALALAVAGCGIHGERHSGLGASLVEEWAAGQPVPSAMLAQSPMPGRDVALQVGMNLKQPDDRMVQADWNAVADHVNGYRFSLKGAVGDQSKPARSAQSRLGFGPVEAWERGTALDTTATLEAGRVRTVTRLAASNYEAPQGGFKPNRRGWRQRDKDLHRFSGVEHASDEAILQRLEATLMEAETAPIGFAVFGQYSSVGRWFESMSLRDRNDPFLNAGHEELGGGGTITAGPFKLTLSQISESDILDDKGRYSPREGIVQQARLEFGLAALAAGSMFDVAALPASLWFTTERGDVNPLARGLRQDDRSRIWGTGLTWSRNLVHAHLGYWYETYDSGGPASVDFESETFDVGVGFYGAAWDIYTGLGIGRTRYPVDFLQATERNLDLSLAAGLRLEHLPDIVVGATFSNYLANYPLDATSGRYDSWELDARFDFTKFLGKAASSWGARLSLIYGLNGYSYADGWTGGDRRVEHVFGILASVPLR